ncbi:type I-E CRISPR-associated protein Cas7/Cse4/CasC [Planotetraspora sp. GP83]|uniref:type I-E CRISPR-associated protein Cas7/Cse4/CasC n=1 Tax=Planotetraspora sp. GP83 TaxID=3156264 RepID=UPI00351116B6
MDRSGTERPARLGARLLPPAQNTEIAMEDQYLSLHAIITFAGVLLNRDENNLPKDLVYGSEVRTRVSAQCWRRAERIYLRDRANEGIGPLAGHSFGIRTREWGVKTARELGILGWEPEQAIEMARAVLSSCGLKFGEEDKRPELTKVAVFAPSDAAVRLATIIHEHSAALNPWLVTEREARKQEAAKKGKGARRTRAAKAPADEQPAEPASPDTATATDDGQVEKNPLPKEIRTQVVAALAPADAIDIALFGRMLAEIAESPNVDGAVQSSHAFTVEAGVTDEDFFTAVDDEKDQRKRYALDAIDASFGDDSGAAITGYQSLTSGTFYRNTVLDREQLRRNLRNGGLPAPDVEAAAVAAELAFTEAFCHAVPTAKKTTTGAPGVLPKLVLAVSGSRPINYASTFERVLTVTDGEAVSTQAVRRLIRQHHLASRKLPGLSRGAVFTYDLDIADLLAKLSAENALSVTEVNSPDDLVQGGRA